MRNNKRNDQRKAKIKVCRFIFKNENVRMKKGWIMFVFKHAKHTKEWEKEGSNQGFEPSEYED